MNLVRHLVISAIRKGRAWLVEYLWRSYGAVLDKVSGSSDGAAFSVQAWVQFWQVCLTAAVLSGRLASTTATIDDKEEDGPSSPTVTIMRFLLHRPGVLKLALAETSLLPLEVRTALLSELDVRMSMTYSPFLHCLLMRGPGHTFSTVGVTTFITFLLYGGSLASVT